MGRESGSGGSSGSGGRDKSWTERHLGPGWVEVEPGIYEFLLDEVRNKTGLRTTARRENGEDENAEGRPLS
jgi:hypothetical protein